MKENKSGEFPVPTREFLLYFVKFPLNFPVKSGIPEAKSGVPDFFGIRNFSFCNSEWVFVLLSNFVPPFPERTLRLEQAVPFSRSCRFPGMVAGDDGCNVSHHNGDAWAHRCCAGALDELFVGDGHNGVSVRRVGLGPENEQVARAQDKAVRGVCFLLVLWIRLAEMEFARLPQAQRNDGRTRTDIFHFVRMVSNVVVVSSIARENGMIQADTLIVVNQVVLKRLHDIVEIWDRTDIAICLHTPILPTRVAVSRHGRWLLINQGHRICVAHNKKGLLASELVSSILEIVI